ncbi:hypothetical protein [Deinococcus saxicola]|uniref:hypothetical protein n=1 Tax=Deinococcus saxicola TaxID=249406 RepID=UPI0039F08234
MKLAHRLASRSDQKAKSEVIAQLVHLARKERLSYDEFAYVCQQARKKLKLEKPKRERRLPQLLTAEELNRFFEAVRDEGQVQHDLLAQAAVVHCHSRR